MAGRGTQGRSVSADPVTEEEELRIREETPGLRKTSCSKGGTSMFHIADGDGGTIGKRCSGGRFKDWDVYPPGWGPFCDHCLNAWRTNNE